MRKVRIFLILLFTICISALYGANADIEKFFSENKDKIWSLNPQQVSIVLGVNLKAQDEFDNIMRYNIKESKDRITFKDMNIAEMLFYFKQRKLQSVLVSFYNRGDSGKIEEKRFLDIQKTVTKFLTSALQCQKTTVENVKFDKSVVQSVKYTDDFSDYILQFSRRSKSPEYIQLKIYPSGKSVALKKTIRADVNLKSLKENVKKSDGNVRYLDIPMVNQGQKGYCAAATVERIMKYYGAEVDQQIIAQIAQSDSARGTNAEILFNVIEKNSAKLNVKVEKVMTEKIFSNVSNFKRFHDVYNDFAAKKRYKRYKFKKLLSSSGKDRTFDFNTFFNVYFYDAFLKARMEDEKNYDRFKVAIRNSINNGVPLIWIAFVFEKSKPGQRIGNVALHMNIINGCDGLKSIIYTDSWGKGHERKFMRMQDAWARTLMLAKIMPK